MLVDQVDPLIGLLRCLGFEPELSFITVECYLELLAFARVAGHKAAVQVEVEGALVSPLVAILFKILKDAFVYLHLAALPARQK